MLLLIIYEKILTSFGSQFSNYQGRKPQEIECFIIKERNNRNKGKVQPFFSRDLQDRLEARTALFTKILGNGLASASQSATL